jgi:uncharacterized protein (DUF952 family)
MYASDEPSSFDDPLRAEEFNALVQQLLPQVRALYPHLNGVAVLRAAARMAEFRMKEDGRLSWGPPRL